MSSSEESGATMAKKKYKGVRFRKWGKWVSEIRVPGTQNRLWLGSYSAPEAAAVAHDIAFYCLHRPSSLDKLNFPLMLPQFSIKTDMSPRSIQKTASESGMAIDAHFIVNKPVEGDSKASENGIVHDLGTNIWEDEDYCYGKWERSQFADEVLSISVEDYL